MTAYTPISGRPLDAALADELMLVSQMLNDLAYDLGSDPDTLRRHMVSLQKVDLVTQMLLIVAGLLRERELPSLAGVTVEDMAIRLRQALGHSTDARA